MSAHEDNVNIDFEEGILTQEKVNEQIRNRVSTLTWLGGGLDAVDPGNVHCSSAKSFRNVMRRR